MFSKLSYAWIITLIMLVMTIIAYSKIDPNAIIPTHWDIYGNVDGYGTASKTFFLMPALTVVVILLCYFLPKLDSRTEKSWKVIEIAATGTVLLMFLAQLKLVSTAFEGINISMNIVPAGVGIFFIVFGNYMPKLRPNTFAGIRTPWTLSSDTVWQKSHRFGSKVFMIAGLLIFIAALSTSSRHAGMLAFLGITLLASAIVFIHSWLLWRKEQKIIQDND